jgi:hypothetical protein
MVIWISVNFSGKIVLGSYSYVALFQSCCAVFFDLKFFCCSPVCLCLFCSDSTACVSRSKLAFFRRRFPPVPLRFVPGHPVQILFYSHWFSCCHCLWWFRHRPVRPGLRSCSPSVLVWFLGSFELGQLCCRRKFCLGAAGSPLVLVPISVSRSRFPRVVPFAVFFSRSCRRICFPRSSTRGSPGSFSLFAHEGNS